MAQTALAGTLGVYVVLAVLLLSLNIASLWRWWVKAAAIIITCTCFVLAYFTITGMIGWPSFTPLPERFSLVATRVMEPNQVNGTEGHVYLWVQEINVHNVPIGAPRGFEVPYTAKLAQDTQDAQSKINSGKSIMGQRPPQSDTATPAPNAQNATANQQNQTPGQMNGNSGHGNTLGGQSTAGEALGQAALTFSDMPPVDLPDKAAIIVPDLNQQQSQ